MEIETIQGLISAVGFPIFVAVWMLFKSSKDSSDLKTAVNELTTVVKILANQKGSGISER